MDNKIFTAAYLQLLAGQLFRKGTNIIVKEERVYSEISSGFLLKMLPVFVSVTLLTLVRISKTRYRWKDLSLLTLLLTNLLTYTESLMDPGRKICIVHMERKRPTQSSKG